MDKLYKRAFAIRAVLVILWLIVTEVSCRAGSVGEPTARVFDLCGLHNGRRIYLEYGRSGLITAKDVHIPSLLVNGIAYRVAALDHL